MWLYSFFGSHTKDSEEVSKASFLKMFPCFKAERLNFVFKYYDAQTDDDALTTRIAAEAEQAGTHFKLLTHLLDIDLSNELIELKLEDETIKTPLLINATGAWIDEVNAKHSLPSRFSIEKLSGIHIEFEGRLTSATLILETRSKRIIFILPQTDTTLIGTTERTEVIHPALHSVAERFGAPCGVVRDLGKAMIPAVKKLVKELGGEIPILSCHGVFVGAISPSRPCG